MPKYIYPLSNIISTFVTFLISLTVLAVVMGYFMIFTDTKMHLTPYVFLAIVPILILLILCMGVENDSRYDARVLPGCGISL